MRESSLKKKFMETRVCQNCKSEFRIEAEDFAFYEKMAVPPPTWCPECRMVRRALFYSNRHLFRTKDALTGKEIFSGIPASAPMKVYDKEYWWSDAWDPMNYGRDYDFSRPFFEQFRELMQAVPWPSRNIRRLIRSDYSNNASDLKNCYLCFDLAGSEDSAYLVNAYYDKNCFDITTSIRGELNYECLVIERCFQTFFSYAGEECRNVWFSRNCTGCADCFGCVNLRSKQYYIFNQPYTQDAYLEEMKRMNLGSYAGLTAARERAREVWRRHPYKFMYGYRNTDVSGDWIAYAKNVKQSFNAMEIEDSKFCQNLLLGVKDSYDFTVWGEKSEMIYEAIQTGDGCRNIKFSWNCCLGDSDSEYSMGCHSSSNLFGCVGLRKKSYCIFNKQYSKEDYMALREKIIRHMHEMPYTDARGHIYGYGEFFPSEFSPFAYNESFAQDLLPLAKASAEAQGYVWRQSEAHQYEITVAAKDLPDHIRDADDGILKGTIGCLACGRAYRIIQPELVFLRSMSLPLPRLCPDCRYVERSCYRNPVRFYHRTCQCAGTGNTGNTYQNQTLHAHGAAPCNIAFETSFAPDRPEIIYCESCYQAEVA